MIPASHRRAAAGSLLLCGLLASSPSAAADYRNLLFQVHVDNGSGRITGGQDAAEHDPENETFPFYDGFLFVDSHRAVAADRNVDVVRGLVVADLTHRQVTAIDAELRGLYPRAALVAGARIRRGTDLTLVALEVHSDESGHGNSIQSTFLVLFVFDGKGLVSKTKPIAIEQDDYAASDTLPEPTWYYVKSDDVESGERNPGTHTLARVLLRDVDGDGNVDVVLWRKNFTSARIGTPARIGPHCVLPYFEAQKDDLRVVRFDPAARTFGDPGAAVPPGVRLPVPDESLWDAVPGLMH